MVPSLHSRRSTVSISEGYVNGGGGGGGGGGSNSLASELVSAVGPSEGGARSLAEEFGIELGGEHELEHDRHHTYSEQDPHFSSSYGHDPQFASPDDFGPDPFSTSHAFDNGTDDFAHHIGNELNDLEDDGHRQGMSLGDELTLGDELDLEPNGLPREHFGAEEGPDQQTPTRAKMRTRTASSSYRTQGGRSIGLGMVSSHPSTSSPSSSRSSSPSNNLRSTSTSSAAAHDDDSDSSDSPLPQRLFSSSNVSSSASSAHRPQTPTLEELIGPPPTVLPLLAKDDRSFELEQSVLGLMKRMEDVGRERDGWSRELGAMDREVARLVSEGVRFDAEDAIPAVEENAGLGVGMRGPMGSLVEDEDDDDGAEDEDEDDLNRSINSSDEDDDRSGTARLQLNGHSPYTPRTKTRPPNPFSPSPTPTPTTAPPRSPSSTFRPPPPPSDGPTPDLPLHLSTLSSHTASLLETLSSLQDATQISLSVATEAGRRARAVEKPFGVMKVEEEGIERAKKALAAEAMTFGQGEAEEVKRRRGTTVRLEMEAFKRAVDEFEAKTKLFREEHERFLVGAV